jgi:hypothetical protein
VICIYVPDAQGCLVENVLRSSSVQDLTTSVVTAVDKEQYKQYMYKQYTI